MKPLWYSHQNLKPQGPFTLEEMRAKVYSGEIGPQDLVCQSELDSWRPAQEWKEFELSLFPASQCFNPGADIDYDSPDWVLLLLDEAGHPRQEGPFCLKELLLQVEQGHVQLSQYVWKSGLSGWVRMSDRPEFRSELKAELKSVLMSDI